MILSQILWPSYLLFGFLILPIIYYIRYHDCPYVLPLFPWNRYETMEFLCSVVYLIYTLSLFLLPLDEAPFPFTGTFVFVLGCGLQGWAVIAMGKNWRIGQDTNDPSCDFVKSGPFRLTRHPIYLSLILLAISQNLLLGNDWRSWLLLAGTLLYTLIQGKAETRYWRRRRR